MTSGFEVKNTFLVEAREEVAPCIQRSTTEPATHFFCKQKSDTSNFEETPVGPSYSDPAYFGGRPGWARLNTGDSLGSSSFDGVPDGSASTTSGSATSMGAGMSAGQPSFLSRVKTFDAMEDDFVTTPTTPQTPTLPVILGRGATLEGDKRGSLPAVQEQGSACLEEEDEEEEDEEETHATSSYNTVTTTATRRQRLFRHSDTFNRFEPPDEAEVASVAALLPPSMGHTTSELTMCSVNSEVMMGNVTSEVTMASMNSFNLGRLRNLNNLNNVNNLSPMAQSNSMNSLSPTMNSMTNMMAGTGSPMGHANSIGSLMTGGNLSPSMAMGHVASMPNLPMNQGMGLGDLSSMANVNSMGSLPMGMTAMGNFNMNTQVSFGMATCPGMPVSIPIATADKSEHVVTLTPPPHPPVDSQASTQLPSMVSTSSLTIPFADVQSGSDIADSDSPAAGRTPSTGTPPAGVPKTTLMLRNLPRCYTQSLLVSLLESEGFDTDYDFLYLPVDFKSHAALGYAFINALDEDVAARMYKHFNNFTKWGVPSNKKCSVGWSYKSMGLDANVQRYRNSPVMHPSVPSHYQPIRKLDGKVIPFEEPTKTIKPPRQGTQLVLP